MAQQLYKRPPITEAVVEIRLETPLGAPLVERVRDRFLEFYPLPPQSVLHVAVQVGTETSKLRQQIHAYRLTGPDGADIVIVGPTMLTTSRLAPYEGWEPFISIAMRNWEMWKKLIGWQKISRIGVRFINRIDVPSPDDGPVNLDEYLLFTLQKPQLDLPPMESFAVNQASDLGKDDCKIIINAGSVPSPLVKTTSLILDIDISRQTNLPQSDDDVWALINRIRDYKNFIFENCITDKARGLFNA
jgi:uncharacterized protein (TIGR04255 family)